MVEHAGMTESPQLLTARQISGKPNEYLASVGEVFSVFGPETQDSGNLSYGVRVGERRFFVKTTDPAASAYLEYPERVALLRNAIALNTGCQHPLMPELVNVIESEAGPMLVYEWVEGELLRAVKGDSESAHERFRRLPVAEIRRALNGLYDLHALLAEAGYVAVDFYDGCLIYDFESRKLHVVDLDGYHPGPFINEMGRMFGSSRFMAPEEFALGARIDEQTTVFSLGRAAALFLGDGSLGPERFRGGSALHEVMVRACSENRAERFANVADFNRAWQSRGR